MSDDLLDCLLSVAEEVDSNKELRGGVSSIQDDPEFLIDKAEILPSKSLNKKKSSVIHKGDTDSSDDEDNRDFEHQKYNEFGKSVKHLMKRNEEESVGNVASTSSSSSWKDKKVLGLPKKVTPNGNSDVLTDPIFGIRIVKPLVSHSTLAQKMEGREAVSLVNVGSFVPNGKDWVIAGVVVHKTSRTSQKGTTFAIWTLSDLHGDLKTFGLFLFGSAYKELWKCTVGTVIGILNPTIFEKKAGSKEEATLSVDNYQRVMIFGQSKDLGTCKSVKKNGDQCTAFVNTNRCEYCIYHIKQEYQKFSKRSELQANFAGGGGLTALRNKVLGKNEVFYAGKSYTAIPASKSRKLIEKDTGRLNMLRSSLNGNNVVNKGGMESTAAPAAAVRRKQAVQLEVSAKQRVKDLELLKKLGGVEKPKINETMKASNGGIVVEESKTNALNVIAKLKAKDVPLLSDSKTIDLNLPISRKRITRANMNALKWVEKNGTIKRIDPNDIMKAKNRKRPIKKDADENEDVLDPKRRKIIENENFSERFKKMMAMTSQHSDLLEKHDNDEEKKYFNKLEIKERMEEKMSTTYKVECKAVRCLKCKYTNFSASDLCKSEKHPLKVFDGVKRFFKCGDCGNRTVTLEIVPMVACKTCGSGKWERTTMMKEKKVTTLHTLSIRGGEQKFINSNASDLNIDL